MVVNDDYIFHIKKLLETQRFIFATFVSRQDLLEQFNTFIKNQKLFLDQISLPKELNNDEHNFNKNGSSQANGQRLLDGLFYDSSKVQVKTAVSNENHIGEESDKDEKDLTDENSDTKFGLTLFVPVKKEVQENINEEVDPARDDDVVDSEEKSENERHKEIGKDDIYTCDICEEIFKTENTLFQHYSKQHDIQKDIGCPAIGCKAIYRKRKSLDEHTRAHHKNENIFDCRICGSMFSLKSELRYHKKTSHNVKLACIDCGIVCTSKIKLRDHRKETHPLEKPYSCSICPQKFLHESALETHTQKIHERTEKYICDTCNKEFLSKCHFEAHIAAHSGVKNFSCDLCDKKFYTKFQKKNHMKLSHIDLGRFQCDQCEYTCSTNGRLKVHITIHNDSERNYCCNHCGALFKTDDVRKTHEKTHTGERTHICEECTRAFFSANKLKRHKKIHTEEFEFPCSSCDKKFHQRGNLKTHIKKFHDTVT